MATALQTLIDAYIKRNANQEITGPVLNGVLSAIADALGTPFIGTDGYWYTYDPETGTFIRTSTQAEGPEGPAGPVGVTEAAATIDANTGTPSVAVSLNGTRLDFTFKNLKGAPGTPGTPGAPGTPGITAAVVTVDGNTGTPSVDASISGTTLTLAFHNLKGEQGTPGTPGAAAGFGTPTATIDANTGTPSVQVSASGPDTAKVFNFTFKNLKGATGSPGTPGAAAGFGTPTASVDANTGTPAVTVTASGPDTAKVFDFAFRNLKGATGGTGAAAGFGTPTASVDANTGTPSVVITPSGPDTAKVFDFAFHNLKGEPGASGIIPVATTQPVGGMLPNVFYDLGTLAGNTTFSFDTTDLDTSVANHWYWTFDTPSTAPTITWPAAITSWNGGSAPTIAASKHYEVSVIDGVGTFMEV